MLQVALQQEVEDFLGQAHCQWGKEGTREGEMAVRQGRGRCLGRLYCILSFRATLIVGKGRRQTKVIPTSLQRTPD